MNHYKYFSDPRRLLNFALDLFRNHIVPYKEIVDVWAKCNNIEFPRIYELHLSRMTDTICKFGEVVERFIRLMIHYDKTGLHEEIVDIKAEMATIYRMAENAGIYFGTTAYWQYSDKIFNFGDDIIVPENELSYGKLIQLLTITWKSLLNAFDISDQDDPPGFKYLGVCRCGDFYVKVRSSQLFCSKSCAQNVRYRRYADKKKKQNK